VRTRAALVVLGAATLAFGLGGLLANSEQTKPLNWLEFLVGGLLIHDAVAVPLTALASVLLVRAVPERVRPAAMGALFVSASLVLVAIPVLDGSGRLANNPSILPSHHYARDLLIAIAVVWALAAAWALRSRRSRTSPCTTTPPGPTSGPRRSPARSSARSSARSR
jgi:hypothetical protein